MYGIHMPFIILEAVDFVAHFTFALCRIDMNLHICCSLQNIFPHFEQRVSFFESL